jgi:superfamily II RNA helicase
MRSSVSKCSSIKLNDGKAKSTINDIILKQIQQLKADDMTIHYIAEKVDFNISLTVDC